MNRLTVPLGLALLALLAACSPLDRVDRSSNIRVNGRPVAVDSKLTVEPDGRRVVDQFAMGGGFGLPRYSPEVQELILTGGRQEAQALCGGEVELIAITREPLHAQTASLRFRCL